MSANISPKMMKHIENISTHYVTSVSPKSQENKRVSALITISIKTLKLGHNRMVKRKTYHFRRRGIIEVEEFHDGNYGAPGERRKKRRKPTDDQIKKQNAIQKAKRCRHKLLEYFSPGDIFATWTYQVSERPKDMQQAKEHFAKAMRHVRKEYKKRGKELYWIRNIEKGTKGAWHIHLVINEIGDTAKIIKNAWDHGGVYISEIKVCEKLYNEDYSKLASYITKSEHTREKKKDGGEGKQRISESSYSTSRNMPTPEPHVDKLIKWKKKPKEKKGYQIVDTYEGFNPVTGYLYRRYTMIKEEGT